MRCSAPLVDCVGNPPPPPPPPTVPSLPSPPPATPGATAPSPDASNGPTGLEAEEVPDEPGAEPDTPMSPDAAAVEEEASAKAALEIEPSELPASQVGEDLEAAPIATLDDVHPRTTGE